MPNQTDQLLFALRNFVRAIDPNNNDPTMLYPSELSAGRELLSVIDKIVDARVQALLPQIAGAAAQIAAERARRTPHR
jgi:hypothetical protein